MKAYIKILSIVFTMIFMVSVKIAWTQQNSQILFQDDFSDGVADGWEVMTTGDWIVENQAYSQKGNYTWPGALSRTQNTFTWDQGFILSINTRLVQPLSYKGRSIGFFDDDGSNSIYIEYIGHLRQLNLRCFVNGIDVYTHTINPPQNEWDGSDGLWHELKIKLDNNHLQGWRDNELLYETIDDRLLQIPKTGFIRLDTWGSYTSFDDVMLTSLNNDNWICLGHNFQRTFCSTTSTINNLEEKLSINITAPGGFAASPIISDDIIYAGGIGNTLYAYDKDTGNEIWHYTHSSNLSTGSIWQDNLVVSTNGSLLVLDRQSGNVIRTINHSMDQNDVCVINDGIAYVSYGCGVFAADLLTGNIVWDTPLSGYWANTPTLSEDGSKIITGIDSNGKYHCLSANNGSILWEYSTSGPWSYKGSSIVGNNVYIFIPTSSSEGQLISLNLNDGTENWSSAISNVNNPSAFLATKDNYLVISTGSYIKCYDTNGNFIWENQYSQKTGAQLISGNNYVIIPCFDGNIYALDLGSGSQKVTHNAGLSNCGWGSTLYKNLYYCYLEIGGSWYLKGYGNQDITPVELMLFTVISNGNTAVLNWSTASETGNYGFKVQRTISPNHNNHGLIDKSWKNVGFIQGSGNSDSRNNYSFTDNTLSEPGTYYYRLKQIDFDGSFEYSQQVEFNFGAPMTFELSQNYPNPFNPQTEIRYQLPKSGNVRLIVYNHLGQKVRTLVDSQKPAGEHTVVWNGLDDSGKKVTSGIYIYKMQVGDKVLVSKKMLLIK